MAQKKQFLQSHLFFNIALVLLILDSLVVGAALLDGAFNIFFLPVLLNQIIGILLIIGSIILIVLSLFKRD